MTSTTTTGTAPEAVIEADPDLPTVRITRSFAAPLERVWRAWTDPELVKQWMGPRSIDMEIETWDMRTGGSYRYTARRDGEDVAHFYGSIHRVEEHDYITQTFGFEEMPDAVDLDRDVPRPRRRPHRGRHPRRGVLDGGAGRDARQRHGGRHQRGLRRSRRDARGLPRMSLPSSPADEHRAIARAFTDRVRGVADGGWDAPSPVAEWQARDVVRHLVEWFPPFLAGGSDVKLAPGPSVDDDPVAAWTHHADAVQAVLDDPAAASTTFAHPRLPELPLANAVSRFYTADVFMHTWDLARATGQDDRLDPEMCRMLYEGMVPMEDVLRGSGQYGAAVPVPDDADWQSKMIGFIGRDPQWAPPA